MNDKKMLEEHLRRLVDRHVHSRKDQVDALIRRLAAGDFFWTPAATTPNYHMAVRGGLAKHSINFIQILIGLIDLNIDQITGGSYLGWSEDMKDSEINAMRERDYESAVIIGLCHDLNKTDCFGKGYYQANILASGKQSDSKPYERVSRFRLGGNLESLMIAAKYIDLYPEEAQAIAWCEGLYNRQFTQEVPEPHYLTHLAHMADMMSSHVIERKEKPARMGRTMGEFEADLLGERKAEVVITSLEDVPF